MNKKTQNLLFNISILLIFLFSIITKLYNLGNFSLDFDEIYSIKTSYSPFWKIALGIRYDPGNPPLYFLLLKSWLKIIGESEFKARLLSVIFQLTAFIILFRQSQKYLSKISTLIVMLFFSSSAYLFFISRYARTYSLIVLLSIAVLPLMLNSLKPKAKPAKIFLTCLLCLIGLYSHYSFVIYLFFLFICLAFIYKKNKKNLSKLFLIYYFIFLGYSFGIVYFISSQFKPIRWWQKYSFGQLGQQWIGLDGWLSIVTNGLSTRSASQEVQKTIALLLLLIFDYLLIKSFRKTNKKWGKTVLFLTFLYVNILVFTPMHLIINDPRYSIYILPFFFLSLGIILDQYKKNIRTIIFLVLIPLLITTYTQYQNWLWEDWKTSAKHIPAKETNSILLFHPCHLGFSLDYYYKGNLPQYCLYENPEGMYLKNWDKKSGEKLYLVTRPYLTKNKFIQKTGMDYQLINQNNYSNITILTFIKK